MDNPYLDERWKKKRAEVYKLREGKCECCGVDSSNVDEPFEVHHIDYQHSREIWQYDPSELTLLCKNCHQRLHTTLESIREILARFNDKEMEDFRQVIFLLAMIEHSRPNLVHKLFETCIKFKPIKRGVK
jgi:hypothetical protein